MKHGKFIISWLLVISIMSCAIVSASPLDKAKQLSMGLWGWMETNSEGALIGILVGVNFLNITDYLDAKNDLLELKHLISTGTMTGMEMLDALDECKLLEQVLLDLRFWR